MNSQIGQVARHLREAVPALSAPLHDAVVVLCLPRVSPAMASIYIGLGYLY